MLGKLRSFTNSKLAGVLVAIIIVPFVFWGMGSVFSGGNTNNVAKINNESISNKEFITKINNLRINPEYIKKNIQNNILEQILSEIISNEILSMEINSINVNIADEILAKVIQSNNQFLDEDGNFSRTKYEKYLLENNTFATEFEKKIKDLELKNNLFSYIGGGIKSPYFIQNKLYIDDNKTIEIDYFNLDSNYNKIVTQQDIDNYISDNKELLSQDHIDFYYKKITPNNLIDSVDYNEEFYKVLDQIENDILNDVSLEEISEKYKLKLENKINYRYIDKDEKYLEEIYLNRDKTNIQLIDKSDYYILFKVISLKRKLPNTNNENFINKVSENILTKRKFDFNKEIFEKIQDKKLTEIEYIKLANGYENIKNITISKNENNNFFSKASNDIIKDLPKNSFVVISNNAQQTFLAKIKKIYNKELDNKNINDEYYSKANFSISSNVYDTYDKLLSKKYNVKIFNNSLERIKENFR